MARPIQWAELATDDLEQIAIHVSRDSEMYAAALVGELCDAARSLSEYAERGRIVPELADPTVRELLVGNFRLIYEIRRQAVFVLGIVHGARDLSQLWSKRTRPDGGR